MSRIFMPSDTLQVVEKRILTSGTTVGTLVRDLSPKVVSDRLSQAVAEERPYGTAMLFAAIANEQAMQGVINLQKASSSDATPDGRLVQYWVNQLTPPSLALKVQMHGTMQSMVGRAAIQKALQAETDGTFSPWGAEPEYQRKLAEQWRGVLDEVGITRLQQAIRGGNYKKDEGITAVLGWHKEAQEGVFYNTEFSACLGRGETSHKHPSGHNSGQATTWMHKVLPSDLYRFITAAQGARKLRAENHSSLLTRLVSGLYSPDLDVQSRQAAGILGEDCGYAFVNGPAEDMPAQAGDGRQRSPTGTTTLSGMTTILAAAFNDLPNGLSHDGKARYGPRCVEIATLYKAVADNFRYVQENHPPVIESVSRLR